jgi:alanine dehydrogenase
VRIGVPLEITAEERRVALTPSGVAALVAHGHTVLCERGAGNGSALADAAFANAGAALTDARTVWEQAELVLKVKEPLEPEWGYLRPGLILFTYLHLAAHEALTRVLLERRVRAVAYETIQLADGTLPLLAPMSEVAGRLSIQAGSWCLEAGNGGRGVLLSGVAGVRPGKVVILGAGISGTSACQVAVGLGAHVSILDIDPNRLRYVHDILGGHVTTVMANRANIEEEVPTADLVIGAVLIPGAKAPKLLTRALLGSMRTGTAFVDISIDQGGCAETSRPTSHRAPTYVEEGVVHYCVANMPGAVPHTATYALTNATLSYALALADHGFDEAVARDPALRRGVNVADGTVRHPGVAEAFGLPLAP